MKPITIPKEFELLGLTWEVEAVEGLENMHDSFGMCSEFKEHIMLDADLKGWKALESFFHEWMHGALTASGYEELSKNEQLVDLLAQMLTQLFKSKKGNAYGSSDST